MSQNLSHQQANTTMPMIRKHIIALQHFPSAKTEKSATAKPENFNPLVYRLLQTLCLLMSTNVYSCLLMSTIALTRCRIFAEYFGKAPPHTHRSVSVRPSFTLRSTFVRPSFILRSSFVRPSFGLRSGFVREARSNEGRTKVVGSATLL